MELWLGFAASQAEDGAPIAEITVVPSRKDPRGERSAHVDPERCGLMCELIADEVLASFGDCGVTATGVPVPSRAMIANSLASIGEFYESVGPCSEPDAFERPADHMCRSSAADKGSSSSRA